MKSVIVVVFLLLPLLGTLQAKNIPHDIQPYISNTPLSKLKNISDIKRNYKALQKLSVRVVSFKEGRYYWKMLLVTNPKRNRGPFMFLPHDNENSAFDTAVYATTKYGGGFLAVMSKGRRYFMRQDPNRNFGDSQQSARVCRQQHAPAPLYSHIVFGIIDTYRSSGMPYLALHNNKDGYSANGGSGGVSILKSTKTVQAYPASNHITTSTRGLKDEDSLVYIASKSSKPNRNKLKRLLRAGLNTKYEVISSRTNDCSMSNYVILQRGTDRYYNIETEHGDTATQKKMFDILMKIK
jgi:hypothetical protein